MIRLLLTNDDGFGSEGLLALLRATEDLGESIIVAPDQPLSGCSHRVTTHRSVQIERRGRLHYSISGTPADCVRIGLHQLVPDATFVLSGINEGGNLGADIHYSGTVAAVREGVLHGHPGIAISQYVRKDTPIDWLRTVRWVRPVLKRLMEKSWTGGTFWNVNLPHLNCDEPDPIVVLCPLDSSPLPLDFEKKGMTLHYKGNYHRRRHAEETDVAVCFRGEIAVTQVSIV